MNWKRYTRVLNVSDFLRNLSRRADEKKMEVQNGDKMEVLNENKTKICKEVPCSKQPSAIPEYIFKLGRGLLSVLLIWLVGWFGFSHAWIVASYVVYVFWCQKKKQRQQKWHATRYFSDYENLKSLKNLPSWVCERLFFV